MDNIPLVRLRVSLVSSLLAVSVAIAPASGQVFDKGLPKLPQPTPGTCAPTAAASSLLWFDMHGYDFLVPDVFEDPPILISTLSSAMGTDLCYGTSAQGIVSGLHAYLSAFGQSRFRMTVYDHRADLATSGLPLVRKTIPGSIGPRDYIFELATRREDVLLGLAFRRPGEFFGHVVAGNSANLIPRDNGTPANRGDDFFMVDFMDPFNGEYFQTRWEEFRQQDVRYYRPLPRFDPLNRVNWNVDFMVAISPVPEPTSILLLGTGLLGLTALALRRRSRDSRKTDAH